jgi:hypothetical protein
MEEGLIGMLFDVGFAKGFVCRLFGRRGSGRGSSDRRLGRCVWNDGTEVVRQDVSTIASVDELRVREVVLVLHHLLLGELAVLHGDFFVAAFDCRLVGSFL